MRSVRILAGVMALAALSMSAGPVRAQAGGDATATSIKMTYDMVKGYVTKAAAQVPEDKYSYQPTKEVRTMGRLFGHIANASALICNTASGMKASSSTDAEKLATKAEIQKAVASAFATCDHAFTMLNAQNGGETIELFGMKFSRLGAMAFNNAHIFEHYGNIVTYMRINGMVPPSSGGGGD
jgi:uncharacterized damage-inducible protein DinB